MEARLQEVLQQGRNTLWQRRHIVFNDPEHDLFNKLTNFSLLDKKIYIPDM